jgi:dipeptidyl-peptidase-4
MLADFSPDAGKVAYTRDNNLYYFDLIMNKEVQITQDGLLNAIINGSTDWVYEEEFAIWKGFYWSPKGDKIAYYRFDESQVKEFEMAMYGKLYPEEYKFKYPKAGEANSVISIYTYDIASGRKQLVDIGKETDIYIPRMQFTRDNNVLCIQRLNRLQNKLELLLCDAASGKSNVIYTEENKAYIDVPEITFLNDGKTFLINSERDGWNHIYQYDLSGKLIKQVTKGNWDVDQFYGINEKKKLVYYSSPDTRGRENRYVFSIGLNGENKKHITPKEGWNTAQFNSDFTYFLNTYSDLNTPPFFTLNTSEGKELRVLEDNKALIEKMHNYRLSNASFQNFDNVKEEAGATASRHNLMTMVFRPADFSETKKYPVLTYVYGGPGHQLAVNRWMAGYYFWFQLLANKGYLVTCTDGRGTGFKGEQFKKCTYLQLGKYEIEDQIYYAKKIAEQPYVDASRMGIWGWSFGGYMSSLGITKGADVFKMAIAVAPVTNWRFYDNIYTERFMRTPQENGKNYDDNSPINHVDKITGKYLLIHGTADDNVHFQNSVEMVDAMIKKGIRFDSEYYPNKNHGISGGKTRIHLFDRMTRFILENL